MRILFSMTNFEIGGAQMFVLRLASHMSRDGHTVFIYDHQPDYSNEKLISSYSANITYCCYAKSKLKRFFIWKWNAVVKRLTGREFQKKYNYRRFIKTLTKNNIQLVNSQMYDSDKICARATEQTGIPFVMTTHGEYELNVGDRPEENINLAARQICKQAKAIIYTAEKNINAIQSAIPENKPVFKVRVGFSPDGIPLYDLKLSEFQIPEGAFVCGMIARGIPEKGWLEAIKALEIIHRNKNVRNIHLVLIGTGTYLENLALEHQSECLHVINYEKDPMRYFSWLKYFQLGLLPTYFEGESVPNFVIECLYHSVPVFASDKGDILDMIQTSTGSAGKIIAFDRNNKPDSEHLADLILNIYNQPAEYDKLREQTRKAFLKFEMNTIAGKYYSIFSDAINVE